MAAFILFLLEGNWLTFKGERGLVVYIWFIPSVAPVSFCRRYRCVFGLSLEVSVWESCIDPRIQRSFVGILSIFHCWHCYFLWLGLFVVAASPLLLFHYILWLSSDCLRVQSSTPLCPHSAYLFILSSQHM